jgi:hypothetical protein
MRDVEERAAVIAYKVEKALELVELQCLERKGM